MRKIPLGNLNSNNPIKTSVKKYHATVVIVSKIKWAAWKQADADY